jgi:hypothetical protein
MGGACIVPEEVRNANETFVGKLKEKKNLGVLGVDVRIILNWIVKE